MLQIRWMIIAVLILGLVSACQTRNQSPANQASPPQADREIRVKQMSPDKPREAAEDPQKIAERLAHLAVQVPGVYDATAVVLGRYAVVGIDLNQTLDRSRVGTIKYAVAETLRDDPRGAYAVITADPDLIQRLREINEAIRKGDPVEGILQELADVVGRIMPQFPRNTEPKEENPGKTNQQRHPQDE